MGTLSCGYFPLIYKHANFLQKNLIIIFISTNVYRPYVYDPLGLYISLVNNFITPITPYWSILVIIYINI